MGDKKSPTRYLTVYPSPFCVDFDLFCDNSMAFAVDIRMISQGVFLPFFSLYARARIVHRHYGGFSLPTLPDTLRQRENFCGYAWHSRKLYSVSTELVRSSMSNGHYLTFVLLANMLSPELKYVASLLASHTSDTTKCCI